MDSPDVVRTKFGTPMDLGCTAIGDPPPLISWLKDGKLVSKNVKTIGSY